MKASVSTLFKKHNLFGLSPADFGFLKTLNTPIKIQDFLDNLPINFEEKGETYMSVSRTLKAGKAHCFEGALLAACCLWLQGQKPLLLDFKTHKDEDHVVTLFKQGGRWGAISKTNHSVLRFRDPVYRSVRELVMSYFHEYFRKDGTKSLRSYSKPFSLLQYPSTLWISGDEELFDMVDDLDNSRHYQILAKGSERRLRISDNLVRKASDITEWGRGAKRQN